MLGIVLTTLIALAPPTTEQSAIFKAAGFFRSGTDWRTRNCEGMEGASYSPGAIEQIEDLNGDARPEAVVTEGSAICYGQTGTRFWLVSKQADGSWKLIHEETAIPDFLATKGAGGWPDIRMGGPGFCFPVWRWNGTAYALHRFEYEGKRCKPLSP